MGIPPAVPVKAAKSIGPCPRIVARIVQAHNGQHTLRGHARACRRRGSRRPHCDSYGKYFLSETDVQRSANDANGAGRAVLDAKTERPLQISKRTVGEYS